MKWDKALLLSRPVGVASLDYGIGGRVSQLAPVHGESAELGAGKPLAP